MKISALTFSLLRTSTIFLLLISLLAGCATRSKDNPDLEPNPMTAHLEKVRQQLEPLNFQVQSSFSESELEYFRYYGLESDGAEHIFGTFSWSDNLLTAHVFRPKEAKGTAILLHGYCDHSGAWRHLIKDLVQARYTVALYDQPGHGLSEGERASIDDFSEYVSALEEFLRLCRIHLPPPYYLIAHSMGGAVTLDYLLTVRQTNLNKVVLIAPLVHSAYWNLSRVAHGLGIHFSDSIPRAFQQTSSDEEFLEFTEKDPLQPTRVSMKWFSALVEWDKRVVGYEPSLVPIKVLQGTGDTTVDWKFNLEFIKEKFPNADIRLIENGDHHLMNESLPMRAEVISLVLDYLEGDAEQ